MQGACDMFLFVNLKFLCSFQKTKMTHNVHIIFFFFFFFLLFPEKLLSVCMLLQEGQDIGMTHLTIRQSLQGDVSSTLRWRASQEKGVLWSKMEFWNFLN